MLNCVDWHVPVITPNTNGINQWSQGFAFGGQGVFDPWWYFGKALAINDVLIFKFFEALGKGSWADAQDFLQGGEALWS
jgi:hypothetical protein